MTSGGSTILQPTVREWALAVLQCCAVGAIVLLVPVWLTLAVVAALIVWPHATDAAPNPHGTW